MKKRMRGAGPPCGEAGTTQRQHSLAGGRSRHVQRCGGAAVRSSSSGGGGSGGGGHKEPSHDEEAAQRDARVLPLLNQHIVVLGDGLGDVWEEQWETGATRLYRVEI